VHIHMYGSEASETLSCTYIQTDNLVIYHLASMAESFYSANPTSPVISPPQSPASFTGPPPPPPPKPSSHHPSRSATPQQIQQLSQPHSQSSVPPPVPPSPSHAQALALQQQQIQHARAPSNLQRQYQQSPTVQAPSIESGWLPEGLLSKSTADLHSLVNDTELVNALAHQHPSYAASLEPLQAAISENLALAQQVAQLEAQVKQLRDQTGQLLLSHTSLQTQWRRKQSEMDDALAPWGPRAMYQRLVSSIGEQEAVLRAVHESFLEGGGVGDEYYGNGDGKANEKEVTEWIKRIREGTTILEKRREMRARWDEGRVGGWR
jgi:hypothetical protein